MDLIFLVTAAIKSFFKFQYKYTTPLDRFMLFMGSIFLIITAITNTLLNLTFGNVTGVIIAYTTATNDTQTKEEHAAAEETLMNGLLEFVLQSTALGAGALVLTYLATVLYNYSAIRQVGIGRNSI